MSQAAADYVRRHVDHQINRTCQALMDKLAGIADDRGRVVGYTQSDAALDMDCSLITAKRAYARVLPRPDGQRGMSGPFLIRDRGVYVILGVEGHDRWTCDSDECKAEAQAQQEQNGGRLSDAKKRQAAARARKYRRRRKEAEEG